MRLVFVGVLLLTGCSDSSSVDVDGDGYCGDFKRNGNPVESCSDGSFVGDCDEGDDQVYPGALEYCDGVDTDCDGQLDEPESVDASAWYRDLDRDGFGDPAGLAKACDDLPEGWSQNNLDCDDTDAGVNPDAGGC